MGAWPWCLVRVSPLRGVQCAGAASVEQGVSLGVSLYTTVQHEQQKEFLVRYF